jgi:hypothetical protein
MNPRVIFTARRGGRATEATSNLSSARFALQSIHTFKSNSEETTVSETVSERRSELGKIVAS